MSSASRPPPAGAKGPNPTSSAYAAQRGSVDMLMKVKPAASSAKAAPTGIERGPAAASGLAAGVKMSFLEAVRAQRQEKALLARNKDTAGGQSLTITTTTITNANTAGRAPKTGGFSALLASSRSAPAAAAAASATTTTSTTTSISTSFAEVQDELEAGFQRYSRANPLGGVGTTLGGSGAKGDDAAQDAGSKGQATTATSRNLKARQLMVAPMARNERQQQQQQQQQQQKKQYNTGGDSSDEEVGRSALGRSKRARKG